MENADIVVRILLRDSVVDSDRFEVNADPVIFYDQK